MQRAHELEFFKDIVFADSTASCDAAGHSVTFILTPCAVGAVPLAVLITKGQSEEEYTAAFLLLKNNLKCSFGGQQYPKVIITDDSYAERNALKFVWPQSKLFLCKFHVLQSMWRWVLEKKHNIEANDRRILYTNFRNILISEDVENANKFYSMCIGKFLPQNEDEESMVNIIEKYPQWVCYIESYWERKNEWCLVYRDATLHGHQTNNFAEISVRLFKDIVLSRNKAYNVIALIDFVITCMEEYYQKRIRNFANGRNAEPRLILRNLLRKAGNVKKDDIIYLGQKIYKVPSMTKQGESYTVDGDYGACTCYVGKLGKFCKHQASVYFHYDDKLVNAPALTMESRYLMAKLAFGDDAPPISFYAPLVESSNEIREKTNLTSDSMHNDPIAPTNYPTYSKIFEKPDHGDEKSVEDLQELFSLMKQHHTTFGTSSASKKKIMQRLKAIKTKTSWETFLCTAGSSLSLRHRTDIKIKVQPTSISRRKAGTTRGCRRLPLGRPAKGEPASKKRKRNLAENVAKNFPNAKSH